MIGKKRDDNDEENHHYLTLRLLLLYHRELMPHTSCGLCCRNNFWLALLKHTATQTVLLPSPSSLSWWSGVLVSSAALTLNAKKADFDGLENLIERTCLQEKWGGKLSLALIIIFECPNFFCGLSHNVPFIVSADYLYSNSRCVQQGDEKDSQGENVIAASQNIHFEGEDYGGVFLTNTTGSVACRRDEAMTLYW